MPVFVYQRNVFQPVAFEFIHSLRVGIGSENFIEFTIETVKMDDLMGLYRKRVAVFGGR